MKTQLNKLATGMLALSAAAVGIQPAQGVTINWVDITNTNNPADPRTVPTYGAAYGSVSYEYRMDAFDVTTAQYAEFLNAIAKTDPNGVYTSGMNITRSGSSGSYGYTVNAGYSNKPIVSVTFWDACRFANWLNNGQPTGAQDNTTTENGAYTLTPLAIANNTISRNPGAGVFLPNVNEWLKAAFYDPTKPGSTNYWIYPTRNDTVPRNPGATVFLPNANEWLKAAFYDPTKPGSTNYWIYPTRNDTVPTNGAPPGGNNSANFGGNPGGLTDVGAYTGSYSFYGLFDAGGDVFEWNESFLPGLGWVLNTRGQTSGGYPYGSSFLQDRMSATALSPMQIQSADSAWRWCRSRATRG